MLHLRVNTLRLVQWAWNSMTSGALLKGIMTMMENFCTAVTGSHGSCITTNTSIIILIIQLTCTLSCTFQFTNFPNCGSGIPCFVSLISVTEWVTHSRTQEVRRDTHWRLGTDSQNVSLGNWSIALEDSEWVSRASNCSDILDQTFLLLPLLASCVLLSSHFVKTAASPETKVKWKWGSSTFAGSTSLS